MDFDALHEAIGQLVLQHFPGTQLKRLYEGQSYDMMAWCAPVDDPPAPEEWKGTMPNDVFVVGPTQTKSGITIHVWHPKQPYLLQDNAQWLKEAGFKPMVGCLQWNRKSAISMDAIGKLLGLAKQS